MPEKKKKYLLYLYNKCLCKQALREAGATAEPNPPLAARRCKARLIPRPNFFHRSEPSYLI